MFEIDLPDPAVVAPLGDAELVDAIMASSKLDSAVQSRHLTAVGELWDRRKRQAQDDEREYFYIDLREAVAAEVSAALGITGSRAAGLIRVAEALRDRLPKVSVVFANGEIDLAMVHAIVSRTELIEDPESMAAVDAVLADRAPGWTKYSRRRIAEYIDSWIGRFDQAGVREKRKPTDNRYLDVRGSGEGMAGIWGNLQVNDAIVFDGRIEELVATVCPNDPRTKAQLRADAVRALSERADRMACTCDDAKCIGEQPTTDRDIVIHVLAESSTVDGDSAAPGYVSGFGPIAADALRGLAKGARRKAFTIPRDAVAEPGYRPSVALAEFVRFRDLHCRFPGCDVPAAESDLDHTIPWPTGPTHPSNIKCLCRKHHLLKTFYVGPGGWRDRQLPDGTVTWMAPTGQTYTTKPGGPLYFAALGQPTGELVLPPATAEPHPERDHMMPRRQRTRAEDVAQRHIAERRRNEARIAAEEQQRSLREIGDCDPPPF